KKIQVAQILPDSPAARSGIQLGDAIADINGQSFAGAEELQRFVDENTGGELNYNIIRERQEITLKITPEIIAETGKGGIGIAIVETGIVRYPWHLALIEGIKTTFFLLWAIIVAFFELLKGLIMGRGASVELAGPVGIAALTGQAARMGLVYIMQFAAMLSINLAIINFFPFPALDGGRVLFLIIEKIKGSPVRRELEAAIHNTGFALLMLLVLLVTFRDVAKFGYIFKNIFEKIF
ncbi:RIP metalloprotease RseP, partial [Patescibacteria group bacterium]|nr:RIP metalloprotease RseP [Patescibacteria group bacterium]